MKFLRSDFFSAGNIIIIIILILIAPFIVSAEKLMNESDAQKLQITSDSMLVNQADFSAHFKGNVMVYFKDYILKTEELIIIYNAKEQNIEKKRGQWNQHDEQDSHHAASKEQLAVFGKTAVIKFRKYCGSHFYDTSLRWFRMRVYPLKSGSE